MIFKLVVQYSSQPGQFWRRA